jgi:hypothetical protein
MISNVLQALNSIHESKWKSLQNLDSPDRRSYGFLQCYSVPSSLPYLTLPRFIIITDGLVRVHDNLFVARSIRVPLRHAPPAGPIYASSSIDDWIDPPLRTVSFLAIAARFSGSREAGRVIINVDSFPAITFGYLKDFVHNSQVGMFGE